MEIGEQDLVSRQLHPLVRLGLLHLHDHLRLGEDVGGAGRDFRTGGAIGVVTGTNAGASACLDQYAVITTGQLRNRIRHEADTRFTNFDFLWNTDKHDVSPDTRNDRTCGKDRCSACPLSGPEFMAPDSGSPSRRTTLEQQMSFRQPINGTICRISINFPSFSRL